MDEEEQVSAFNPGNFLFGVLGSWCAIVVCLLVYSPEAEAPGSREPAQETPQKAPPKKTPTDDTFEPSAYMVSFNSIHFEK